MKETSKKNGETMTTDQNRKRLPNMSNADNITQDCGKEFLSVVKEWPSTKSQDALGKYLSASL